MFIPAGYESEFDSDNEYHDFEIVQCDPVDEKCLQETQHIHENRDESACDHSKNLEDNHQNPINDGCSYFTNASVINQKFFGKGSVADENIKRMILVEDVEMITQLIDNNELEVNYQFSSGWSLSSFSLFTKKYVVFELLHNLDADLNYGSMSCLSAMAYATYNTYDEFEQSLVVIEKVILRCDLDLADNYGKTATMIAIENNNFHIAEVLLRNHPNISIEDVNGKNVFGYALDKKSNKIVQFLLSYFDCYEKKLDPTNQHNLLENYKLLLGSLLKWLGPSEANIIHKYMLTCLLESETIPQHPFKDTIEFCLSYKKKCNIIEDKDGDIMYDFLCGIQCEKWFTNFQAQSINFKQFLQLSNNDLENRLKINTLDSKYIIKARNELILNGLDSGIFTKSSDDLNVFDLAVSNSNTHHHLECMIDFCDNYIQVLVDQRNMSYCSNYFIKLATKHTRKNIESCKKLTKKLCQIKDILENKKGALSSYRWHNLLYAFGAITIFSAVAYKLKSII